MRVVDLSHPVKTGMQVFPGDPSVSCRVATTVEQDGFEVTELHPWPWLVRPREAPLRSFSAWRKAVGQLG